MNKSDLYAARIGELVLAGFKRYSGIVNSQEETEGAIYMNRVPGSPYEGEGFDVYLDGSVVPHSGGTFKFSNEVSPK